MMTQLELPFDKPTTYYKPYTVIFRTYICETCNGNSCGKCNWIGEVYGYDEEDEDEL